MIPNKTKFIFLKIALAFPRETVFLRSARFPCARESRIQIAALIKSKRSLNDHKYELNQIS